MTAIFQRGNGSIPGDVENEFHLMQSYAQAGTRRRGREAIHMTSARKKEI
jgi:hypothetical protein